MRSIINSELLSVSGGKLSDLSKNMVIISAVSITFGLAGFCLNIFNLTQAVLLVMGAIPVGGILQILKKIKSK